MTDYIPDSCSIEVLTVQPQPAGVAPALNTPPAVAVAPTATEAPGSGEDGTNGLAHSPEDTSAMDSLPAAQPAPSTVEVTAKAPTLSTMADPPTASSPTVNTAATPDISGVFLGSPTSAPPSGAAFNRQPGHADVGRGRPSKVSRRSPRKSVVSRPDPGQLFFDFWHIDVTRAVD